jgi:branched-subunit amino acid aminotransferase/4-amino-4-deoxychorismate lyase
MTHAVWLNGRIVSGAQARVPLTDRGLLYGDGLLDTLRIYEGHPFMLIQHLARLKRSARALGIPFRGDTAFWQRAITRLLDANRMDSGAVRLTLTRGTAPGLRPPPRPTPTAFLQLRAIDPALQRGQRRGVAVRVVPFDRGPAMLAEHKTLAYLPAVLAQRQARRHRAFDGLYSGPDGCVTEATTANLFVMHRGRLVTPARNILPGVARGLVLQLARDAGLEIDLQPISGAMLRGADEIFLTASVVEVLPVRRVDGQRVGTGSPGPVTRTLQAAYAECVSRSRRRKV